MNWQRSSAPSARRAELFRDVWSTLKQTDNTLCILSGYEQYPDHIDSDVDAFSVDPEQIPRILFERKVTAVAQVLQHETTAFYYVLCRRSGDETTYIALDVCSDYRRNNRTWLKREEFIGACRPYKFFDVPIAELEFIYYLIKKLCKGSIDEEQTQRLSRLYNEDPTGCDSQLARFFPPEEARSIARAARSGDWEWVLTRFSDLRETLLCESRRKRPWQLLKYRLGDYRRGFGRVIRPTGLMVAFLGADGSGKSTVVERVVRNLAPAFRKTARYHLRPRLYVRKRRGTQRNTQVPVTEPHAQPSRGLIPSMAKLAFWWLAYTFGYLRDVFPLLTRSTLVVFDRYYHDILVDTKRYRYRGPSWPARLVGKVVPRPHLFILLDAPPEVLFSRKQEVAFEEVGRQREAYLELVRSLDNGHVVDASKPLDEVVSEVEKVVLDHLIARTARRTGVG